MLPFIADSFPLPASNKGKLNDLSFTVKDNIQVAGHKSSNGNPAWKSTHEASLETAFVVAKCLDAGASMSGIVVCDEMCFSLNGENFWYGTPENPAANDRMPGGSSSGSTSSVAAGLADFSLGTDTSGSVRVPASYCGVIGLRTSQGLISKNGVIPLAPAFDVVGVLASRLTVLCAVTSLFSKSTRDRTNQLLIPRECLDCVDTSTAQAFELCAGNVDARPNIQVQDISLGFDLQSMREVLRSIQAGEIWSTHNEWLKQNGKDLSGEMESRLRWAERVSVAQLIDAQKERVAMQLKLDRLLGEGRVLAFPTTPGAAPLLNAAGEEQQERRNRTVALAAISSLSGRPELSLPLLRPQGLPVGFSLLGAVGAEFSLLDAAANFGSFHSTQPVEQHAE